MVEKRKCVLLRTVTQLRLRLILNDFKQSLNSIISNKWDNHFRYSNTLNPILFRTQSTYIVHVLAEHVSYAIVNLCEHRPLVGASDPTVQHHLIHFFRTDLWTVHPFAILKEGEEFFGGKAWVW